MEGPSEKAKTEQGENHRAAHFFCQGAWKGRQVSTAFRVVRFRRFVLQIPPGITGLARSIEGVYHGTLGGARRGRAGGKSYTDRRQPQVRIPRYIMEGQDLTYRKYAVRKLTQMMGYSICPSLVKAKS